MFEPININQSAKEEQGENPSGNKSDLHQKHIQQLIEENSALFWYIPEQKKSEISEDVLVEFVLNYGNYDACKNLLKVLGTREVAKVFFSHISSERRKHNYFPEII